MPGAALFYLSGWGQILFSGLCLKNYFVSELVDSILIIYLDYQIILENSFITNICYFSVGSKVIRMIL